MVHCLISIDLIFFTDPNSCHILKTGLEQLIYSHIYANSITMLIYLTKGQHRVLYSVHRIQFFNNIYFYIYTTFLNAPFSTWNGREPAGIQRLPAESWYFEIQFVYIIHEIGEQMIFEISCFVNIVKHNIWLNKMHLKI